MIIEWSLYILTTLVSFVLIYLIYGYPTDYLLGKISNKNNWSEKSKEIGQKSGGTIGIIIAVIVTYFLFNYLSYYPPLNSGDVELITDTNKGSEKIDRLTIEIDKTRNTLSNIENLTINQIQVELEQSLFFFNELKEEAVNQKRIINNLQKTIQKEKKKAEDAINHSKHVTSLTKEQINAINDLLTTNAKKDNQKSFWIGVGVSFPVGVTASILGTIILSRIRRKEKTVTNK